jgi:hypothetical protein
MSNETTTTTETTDVTTIKAYVPHGAGETEPLSNGETVLETLKSRACDHYGGFTAYEASGGWMGPNGVVEEPVTVLEILVPESANVEPETFAKVNARWMFRATDEQMVMFKCGNETVVVQ